MLRAGGMPRLGAVAVGHGSDRWMLAQLVVGSGPGLRGRRPRGRGARRRVDRRRLPRAHAPRRRPRSRVDHQTASIPREARAALAGSTVTVAGRLRRQAAEPHRLSVPARGGSRRRVASPRPGLDARRGRPGETLGRCAHRGDGRSRRGDRARDRARGPRRAASLRGRAGSSEGRAESAPFDQRVLGLSPTFDSAFAARIQPGAERSVALARAAARLQRRRHHVRRGDHRGSARHRGSRRAARGRAGTPGRAFDPTSRGLSVSMSRWARTAARSTCTWPRPPRGTTIPCSTAALGALVSAISFFAAGTRIHVTYQVTLPPARTSRKTQCSVASTLPLPVRRGLWRSRLQSGRLDYVAASRACELPDLERPPRAARALDDERFEHERRGSRGPPRARGRERRCGVRASGAPAPRVQRGRAGRGEPGTHRQRAQDRRSARQGVPRGPFERGPTRRRAPVPAARTAQPLGRRRASSRCSEARGAQAMRSSRRSRARVPTPSPTRGCSRPARRRSGAWASTRRAGARSVSCSSALQAIRGRWRTWAIA